MLSFTSTIHDPENRLGYLIEEVGEPLKGLFGSATVAYTPKTHPDLIRLLVEKGYVVREAGSTVISTYQTALKMALDGDSRIFYCDLDRALHWIRSYSEELRQLAGAAPGNDFMLIGRTRRAFSTHPETQTYTEGIGNMVASRALGFEATRDVLGTTWVLTHKLAKRLLELMPVNEFGFYTQWPMTLWRTASDPLYIECEGLEWETSDRFPEETRTLGSLTWKKEFQTADEWKRRTAMLRDFVVSSMQF